MWRIDNGGCQDGNLKPGKVDDKPPFVVEMSGVLFIMNYRKLYAKHYGIKIPPEYDIHHIDFDRNNNNIENLLLLPKKLHRKLHHVRNTSCVNLDRFFDFQGIAAQRPMDYERRCINAALDVYDELQIWSCRKNFEDIMGQGNWIGDFNYNFLRDGNKKI